jgi:hypothetical protein
MAEEGKQIQEVVLTRLMRLNAVLHGIVAGLIIGVMVFIATVWLVLKGGRVVGPHLGLLSNFFFGYRVTWVGSVIGFAWGFFYGYAGGYLVARFYNWLVDLRGRKRQRRA